MSRSGYSDDCDDLWAMVRWRGAVTSALRGARGQAFLRELVEALDALPEKRLAAGTLVSDQGCPCAMGAVAIRRGLDVSTVDPEDYFAVADLFGVARAMVREIAYENDEYGPHYKDQTQEERGRWERMRKWAVSELREPAP